MKFVLCKCFCLLLLFAAGTDCFSQEVLRSIRGVVSDKRLREPVEFVNVIVEGTTLGAMTDSLGRFEIKNVHPGIYKLKASSIGYTTVVTPDYIVSNHDIEVEIEIEENRTELEGVVVTITMRVGENDKLYGSVTPAMIGDALAAMGIEVDRHRLLLDGTIRTLGEHHVRARLHADVVPAFTVKIVSEEKHIVEEEAPVEAPAAEAEAPAENA